MPNPTELLERASDNREQAVRLRTLCQSLAVDGRGQADLEYYAGKLDQKAADLERLARFVAPGNGGAVVPGTAF